MIMLAIQPMTAPAMIHSIKFILILQRLCFVRSRMIRVSAIMDRLEGGVALI
jgi:hypothetical protein